MVSKIISKKNFYFTFFEKNKISNVYKEIWYLNNEVLDLSVLSSDGPENSIDVLLLELFPSYFIPKFNIKDGIEIKKIFRVKGFCINTNNLKDIDSYIQANFKPNLRTSLRRRIKGLETSFDVRYKLFYGQITGEEYEFLMNALHTMLKRRFNQRNDETMALRHWDHYYNSVFSLINQKKASLYVIYDGQNPIQISLSYHFEKITCLAIPSYNIDYAKFGLGNIAVHKLLEWCISNNYEILDMGFGAFDYKLKWCNHSYDFEHHVFYKKKSFLALIALQFISFKTRFINYLLAKGVNKLYHKIKSLFSKKSVTVDYEYEVIPVTDSSEFSLETPPIDFINDTSFTFLKKSVYDFLYTHKEHISKVQVYEIKKNKSYLIKSQKDTQKIVFKR